MSTTTSLPVITDIFSDTGGSLIRVENHLNPQVIPYRPLSERTDDNTPLIMGSADPGATVLIYDNYYTSPIGSPPIGTALTAADGKWSFQTTSLLASGVHDFSVGTTDSDQHSLYPYNTQYDVVIAKVLPPTITSIENNSSQLVGQFSNTESGDLKILGTAEPGCTIQIFDNGIKIGEVRTNKPYINPPNFDSSQWQWEFDTIQPLENGIVHKITATAVHTIPYTDLIPISTTEYAYTIGVGITPPKPDLLAPVITSVVDDVGANQGVVADGGQTNDVRPTLHGTSEPGTVVTVSDNGHVIGTATTGADWQWTFTPGADLTAGANTLSVSAARADGTGSVAAWYTHGLDVTPSLDAVLATAGLSAAPAAAPTVQAAYVSAASEAAHAATAGPVHDLAY